MQAFLPAGSSSSATLDGTTASSCYLPTPALSAPWVAQQLLVGITAQQTSFCWAQPPYSGVVPVCIYAHVVIAARSLGCCCPFEMHATLIGTAADAPLPVTLHVLFVCVGVVVSGVLFSYSSSPGDAALLLSGSPILLVLVPMGLWGFECTVDTRPQRSAAALPSVRLGFLQQNSNQSFSLLACECCMLCTR